MTGGNDTELFHNSNGLQEAHLGADDIGWQALAPALGCSILATLVVAARWYSRSMLARCIGVDDYVILLSLLLSWAMTTTIGISVHEGAGTYHTAAEAAQIARLVIAGNVLWILIVVITKASILTQYLRIFCSVRTRAVCYTILACLVPAALYSIFAGIFLCTPTSKLWEPSTPGTCRSAQTYWLSVAGLDISLDFLVLLLPLPAILRLRLPSRQKLALVLVFTLGFFVCLVSIARLASVYLAAQKGKYVASGVWAVIWSAVEANVGIICACLLALKPLAARLFPRFFDETKVPRHAMFLKPVDTSQVAQWSQVDWPWVHTRGKNASNDLSNSVVTLPPATPSSGTSKEGKGSEWNNATAAIVPPRGVYVSPELRYQEPEDGLSEVERLRVVQREDGTCRQCGGERKISIWDMLQQREEMAVTEANSRRERKGR